MKLPFDRLLTLSTPSSFLPGPRLVWALSVSCQSEAPASLHWALDITKKCSDLKYFYISSSNGASNTLEVGSVVTSWRGMAALLPLSPSPHSILVTPRRQAFGYTCEKIISSLLTELGRPTHCRWASFPGPYYIPGKGAEQQPHI